MAPESSFSTKKQIGLTADMAAKITTFRYDQRLPSNSAAIRRLLERGLETYVTKPPAAQQEKAQAAWPLPLEHVRAYPAREIAAVPADATADMNVKIHRNLRMQLRWLIEARQMNLRALVEELLSRGVASDLKQLGIWLDEG